MGILASDDEETPLPSQSAAIKAAHAELVSEFIGSMNTIAP